MKRESVEVEAMNETQKDLSFPLMQAVLEGRPKDEIRMVGKEAKRFLWGEWQRLISEANIIDTIVYKYALDPNWRWGVQDPDSAPPAPVTTSPSKAPPSPSMATQERKNRILRIARQMSQEGAKTVTTADIAERLRAEGDTTPLKNLTTGVGNTLSRNGWRRIGAGVYEALELEAAMA